MPQRSDKDNVLTGEFAKILIKIIPKPTYFGSTEKQPSECPLLEKVSEQLLPGHKAVSLAVRNASIYNATDFFRKQTRQQVRFHNSEMLLASLMTAYETQEKRNYLGCPPLSNIPAVILFH